MLHLFDESHNNNNSFGQHNNSSEVNYNQDAKATNALSAGAHRDAFTELLYNVQYSHYVYYKYGTCFPIKCSPSDVQRIARLLGRRSILMTGPVKCHSKYPDDYEQTQQESVKHGDSGSTSSQRALQISTRDLNNGIYIWKPHITKVQLISLIVISSVGFIVIILTLVDIVLNRVPKLCSQVSRRVNNEAAAKAVGLTEANAEAQSSLLRGDNVDSDLNNNLELRKLGAAEASLVHDERTKNNAHQRTTIETEAEIECEAEDKNVAEEVGLQQVRRGAKENERSLFMTIVDDYSIVNNAEQFFKISEGQLKNDILCLNGIRCITMSWIIITHTMQYNDWSAFARIREVETHLQSLINQPLFNASYLVDTFFVVSGLLTSFSSFKCKQNERDQARNKHADDDNSSLLKQFSSKSYLIGRYLRLTPQILFVSLLFILLPLASRSGGPHWYTITGEYSENCSENWWINLLHIQAFYRSNEMCNFVSWWISVDMFYHLFALALILAILNFGHKIGFISCSILVIGYGFTHAIRHYRDQLPPNLLSTIPQTGAMWSKMTLEFFWTPQAHTFPFFLGFYIGYLMVRREKFLNAWLNTKRSIVCWIITTCLLVMVSYGTYFWVVGKWNYPRLVSTIFYIICPIIWATCLSWIIVACHFGFGGWINQMLSCKLFIILGKASYIVYLSHFLVLFTFFGSQNLLLEPTQLVMFYVIFGNICLSMLFGSILCIVFEMPWLKTQKRLMRYVR